MEMSGTDVRRRADARLGGARAPRHGSYLGKSYRTIVRSQFVLVAVDANSSLVQRVVGVVVVFFTNYAARFCKTFYSERNYVNQLIK